MSWARRRRNGIYSWPLISMRGADWNSTISEETTGCDQLLEFATLFTNSE